MWTNQDVRNGMMFRFNHLMIQLPTHTFSTVTEILQALEKVLLDLLESKISEALLLVPENYGMTRIAVNLSYRI